MRPAPIKYDNPSIFIKDMVAYLKANEPGYSVLKASKNLRKISPSLISLIIQGKRNLTYDRVDELTKLLRLNLAEKNFLKNSLLKKEIPTETEGKSTTIKKRDVSTDILKDWINIYVKDLFQIDKISKNPGLVYGYLAHIASPKRIEKSLRFLLHEGHLRRTPEGHILPDVNLSVADPKTSDLKIRNFHKGALSLSRLSIDMFSAQERLANTLVIPLDKKKHDELLELIDEFSEKLKTFAEDNSENPNQVYQLLINLSPIGGKM